MEFGQPVPILRIFDEAKAREFYVDFLGFQVDWENRLTDEAPVYMQISMGNCILHLSEHFGDSSPGSSLRITTEDVHGFQQTLIGKAYRHANPGVETMPWGTSDMSISDPFGNRLIFSTNAG